MDGGLRVRRCGNGFLPVEILPVSAIPERKAKVVFPGERERNFPGEKETPAKTVDRDEKRVLGKNGRQTFACYFGVVHSDCPFRLLPALPSLPAMRGNKWFVFPRRSGDGDGQSERNV